MLQRILLILNIVLITQVVYSQSNSVDRYRNDQKGDYRYRREGIMDGNLVRTIFYNNGEVGQWPFQPSGEWPKGTGHSYLDGVGVLIATELNAPGNNEIIHPLQTCYREWMDKDPLTGTIWGLEPLPGYMNPSSENPAINTHFTSWPSEWPAALDLTTDWNGYWYGYFGRGVMNSDFETFYVMDDSKDGEFKRAPYSYFPLSSDHDRGGLGIRVEVRGFQWSHVLAEDIIFWHYDIVNISDFDYPKTAFGFYTDCGVGGTDDSGDDNASYDTQLDLAYCFDNDGLGVPGNWKTGYYGYAYLESPGNAANGIDDDADLLTDERRDDGIDNDGDWMKYSDVNNNGQWDAKENEPVNDDVGKDGVGPLDAQYLGADEGEGDGIPTDGEPNFDKTDKDESDQIGLTAVSIYRLGEGGTGGGWAKDDESMWLKMSAGTFDTAIQRSNISMVFASGPFPLFQGKRERFSMALVFGNDHEDIAFNKETVQQIYNSNYNFSKPPTKPTLTAVPGDKKVFLYWDAKAEESRDPFLGFQNGDPAQGYKKDFEGYLVYRSEEAEFNDIKVITDSKGDPKYGKPIAQFDLVDSIKGPDPVGINGAHFWRGTNSGLQHSYIDTDIENGKKYYYAVVSYDMGDPAFGTTGLQPSECTKIISEDYAGGLQFIDLNCAVVTPNAPSAGYTPPQILGDLSKVTSGLGTGTIMPIILNPNEIKDGAEYKILFNSTSTVPVYTTQSFSIIRSFQGVTDTLFPALDSTFIGSAHYAPPFDGLTMEVLNDTSLLPIDSLCGWVVGNSNLNLFTFPDPAKPFPYPNDYEIEFSNTPQDTSFFSNPPLYRKFPVNLKVTNLTTGTRCKVAIKDNDGDTTLSYGDVIQILEFIGTPSVTNAKIAWDVAYFPPFNPGLTPIDPVEGDIFRIITSKPFMTGDYFTFQTKPVSMNNELAKTQLANINVVPNPYLGAASWERRTLNSTGRGERKIDFINLPADCTIRIYSMTGSLVKTLKKESVIADGSVSWDLVSDDGMEVAYGVYIYHVDAPGVGEHVGKFALIK